MLIAIMGDTFSRHNEDLHANATRQKLVLQAEFVSLVNFYQKIFARCCTKKSKNPEIEVEKNSTGYLFVIQPSEGGEEHESGDSKGGDSQSGMILKVIE